MKKACLGVICMHFVYIHVTMLNCLKGHRNTVEGFTLSE